MGFLLCLGFQRSLTQGGWGVTHAYRRDTTVAGIVVNRVADMVAALNLVFIVVMAKKFYYR